MSGVRWLIMSSKRVWAVRGQYSHFRGAEITYGSLEEALADIVYIQETGSGSASMRSYVVPA